MNFKRFIRHIDSIRAFPLPGREAHNDILPSLAKERIAAFQKDKNPRISSVAATIYPKDNRAYILLIERQTYKGVHSGQISFPGGKQEAQDQSLIDTALREMHEEVGIDPDRTNFVRNLSELYIPPSRFLVYPYLFYLDQLPPLIKQKREVKNILEVPLEHILSDESIVSGKIRVSNGVSLVTPYFKFCDYKIWGATAMMLSELRQMIKKIDS